MRLGLRTKQVAGVTAVVALASAVLFGWYLASLAHIMLAGTRSNAQLLANAIYQRTFVVVGRGGDFAEELGKDDGLRSILESISYSRSVEYAIIVDPEGRVLAHADSARIGEVSVPKGSLDVLIDAQGPISQLRAIYTPGGRTLEIDKPLVAGAASLGAIRVGVSTLLLQTDLQAELVTPILTALGVIAAAILVSMLLARLVLRPIHVIRSGLARLGRGELDVQVDLPADVELTELGDSFRKVSERIAADRSQLAGQQALESVVDRLEDAVALFGTDGALLFANPAMRSSLPETPRVDDARRPAPILAAWPAAHPYRVAVEGALAGTTVDAAAPVTIPGEGDRLVLTHLVPGAGGRPLGVLLVSRNLAYLSQVESTLKYSRKLAAFSRLTGGIAHEIKNPLNAAMIHLELLRGQVADLPDALQSVGVITDQVRRLDEVVQTFMKFTRPEDLHLQAVDLADAFERLRPVLDAEATKHRVDLKVDIPAGLPAVDGDPNLLDQAFLNLALNAFQAMPNGGRLRVSARETPGRLVTIEIEDSGVGIAPEHLTQIFDLYYTTKPSGSGIGLSLVFRTVQLHDGEIEVQSTLGRGTTFKIRLRQAAHMFQGVGA